MGWRTHPSHNKKARPGKRQTSAKLPNEEIFLAASAVRESGLPQPASNVFDPVNCTALSSRVALPCCNDAADTPHHSSPFWGVEDEQSKDEMWDLFEACIQAPAKDGSTGWISSRRRRDPLDSVGRKVPPDTSGHGFCPKAAAHAQTKSARMFEPRMIATPFCDNYKGFSGPMRCEAAVRLSTLSRSPTAAPLLPRSECTSRDRRIHPPAACLARWP